MDLFANGILQSIFIPWNTVKDKVSSVLEFIAVGTEKVLYIYFQVT